MNLGGLFQGYLLWQLPDHHNHLAAFHLGHAFDLADILDVFGYPFQQFAAQIDMRHLAAPKPQADFHLVTIGQKLEHVAHFHVIVMGVRIGAELDFFDLDDLLLFTGFGLALLLFVFELAEIHDLAHRRIGVGRNLDQIQTGIIGHLHSTRRGHNPCVFAIGSDQPDFIGSDAFIYARASVALWRGIVRSAGYSFDPLIVNSVVVRKIDGVGGAYKVLFALEWAIKRYIWV